MQHLLNFKQSDPLNLKNLWLPGLGQQPHLLTNMIHRSRYMLYLTMHGFLCLNQTLLSKIQLLLIVCSSLVDYVILNLLWFIANS